MSYFVLHYFWYRCFLKTLCVSYKLNVSYVIKYMLMYFFKHNVNEIYICHNFLHFWFTIFYIIMIMYCSYVFLYWNYEKMGPSRRHSIFFVLFYWFVTFMMSTCANTIHINSYLTTYSPTSHFISLILTQSATVSRVGYFLRIWNKHLLPFIIFRMRAHALSPP